MGFFSFLRAASRIGCLPFIILRVSSWERMGLPASICIATSALALMKSISPMNFAPAMSSGRYGRRKSENSLRMRSISLCWAKMSSFTWLLSSTTSIGSMKTVFPVADSSYTNPGNLRLFTALTGMRSRPSLAEMLASSSASPSSCALRSICCIFLEMEFSFSLNDLRILKSSGVALSLTSPKRSTIDSIRLETSGKNVIGEAISLSAT